MENAEKINKQLDNETDLYHNKQFLETVFNGITEQICVISKNFKILWANKTFLEQSKCEAEEGRGRAAEAGSYGPPHGAI